MWVWVGVDLGANVSAYGFMSVFECVEVPIWVNVCTCGRVYMSVCGCGGV